MRFLVMALLFLLGLILQSTLFSHLTVAGVKPDLVLILIIFYSMLHGTKEGLVVGFVGGLMQDLLLGHHIGLNILAKTVTGFSFGFLERKIYKENLFIPMLAVFLGTFFHESLIYLLNLIEGAVPGYLISVKSIIFSTAVYNTCLVPILYRKFYNSSHRGLMRSDDYHHG